MHPVLVNVKRNVLIQVLVKEFKLAILTLHSHDSAETGTQLHFSALCFSFDALHIW